MTDTRTDAPPITEDDIGAFVIMLNEGQDEIACEFRHVTTTCSIEVTHRLVWCQGNAKICQNGVEGSKWQMALCFCINCKRNCDKCWRLVPI